MYISGRSIVQSFAGLEIFFRLRSHVEQQVQNAQIGREREFVAESLGVRSGVRGNETGIFRMDGIPEVGVCRGAFRNVIFGQPDPGVQFQQVGQCMEYVQVEVQQILLPVFEIPPEIFFVIVVKRGIFVGGFDAFEMQFLPGGGIIYLRFFCQEFDFPVFLYGNRQRKLAVGRQNLAPVPVALFPVMFELLDENRGMPVQPAYIRDRGKIGRIQ